MDERPPPAPEHVPVRELPFWRRIGRALQRAVWPVAGAKDDPWLAQPDDPDPDAPKPRGEEPPAP